MGTCRSAYYVVRSSTYARWSIPAALSFDGHPAERITIALLPYWRLRLFPRKASKTTLEPFDGTAALRADGAPLEAGTPFRADAAFDPGAPFAAADGAPFDPGALFAAADGAPPLEGGAPFAAADGAPPLEAADDAVFWVADGVDDSRLAPPTPEEAPFGVRRCALPPLLLLPPPPAPPPPPLPPPPPPPSRRPPPPAARRIGDAAGDGALASMAMGDGGGELVAVVVGSHADASSYNPPRQEARPVVAMGSYQAVVYKSPTD